MAFATIISSALLGVDAVEVTVETHLSNGLPGFAIVGLPETAVKESKERVRSAIINSGLDFPARRITVNLAPADLPKAGGRYDLAIALSILSASGQLNRAELDDCEVLGELALDGSVRKVFGAIPAIIAAARRSRKIYVPAANLSDLAVAGYEQGLAIRNLNHCVDHFVNGGALLGREQWPAAVEEPVSLDDLSQIKGQSAAKRALQISAAGGHNLLMIGPPGSGKTLLANSLISLLPALNDADALEVAAINSVANFAIEPVNWRRRPIRSPHHSATSVALVGGGNKARPGEISLAHKGVLFLDELTEFKAGVLDALREPLESGEITVSRANYRIRYPANFQLIAAMNPCPCGHAGDIRHECRCPPGRVERYLSRLSGPLLDRLDLLIEVPGLSHSELLSGQADAEDWQAVKQHIQQCQQRQFDRAGKTNAQLTNKELQQYCSLDSRLRRILASAMEKLGLSARATYRVIKIARTIADYEESAAIREQDLMEAISYRRCHSLSDFIG